MDIEPREDGSVESVVQAYRKKLGLQVDEEPPFVEAEVIEEDEQASPPATGGSPVFQNNYYGGAPKKVTQVNGTLNITSLDDL
ncbi:hypothetical protein [Glycomyces buryatensis]|uniref:Uncharacterized protein n=1 Tax=Glycomyces buryatensis TaxID=2570927 RepID=A0A4S8QA00_9ACTN|nr:hypothetical protein [Glycomyces buryatensis]THV39642.1 hypothetical protein FAB82_17385 [Glycomyces buryatensis]